MTEPLHILHVFSTFRTGGPQIRFTSIANSLAVELRHTIIAADGNHEAAQSLSGAVRYRLLDAPANKRSLLAPLAYAATFREARPDLIQTYNWGAMDAVIGSLLTGIPLIHTEDGFNPDEAVQLKRRRVWMRRVFLNRVYKTIIPSETLRAIALNRYRIDPGRVQLLRNGVDTERFRPFRNNELRRQLGIPDGAVAVGTVARFSAEKNLGLLLDSFREAAPDDARLILLGDGDCREPLIARALGDKRIFFPGAIAEVASWYGVFDLFAMSSTTEQMPMALLEAMSSGLPVLSTGVGDIPAILGASQAPELVPRGDAPAYAGALRCLILDSDQRATLGAKNRSRAVARFSLPGMLAEYLSLYRSAAQRPPSRA